MVLIILFKKFFERISMEYFLSEVLFFLKAALLINTYLINLDIFIIYLTICLACFYKWKLTYKRGINKCI